MSAGAEAPGEPPTRAIVLLAFAGFVSAANLRVCDPLLPQIAGELSVTIGGAGAIVTAFASPTGCSRSSSGRWAMRRASCA